MIVKTGRAARARRPLRARVTLDRQLNDERLLYEQVQSPSSRCSVVVKRGAGGVRASHLSHDASTAPVDAPPRA